MFLFLLFFFSSPLIKTTSPSSAFISLVLCIILCFFRRDRKYSFFHLFHAVSLQLLILRWRFFISGVSSSSLIIGCPYNKPAFECPVQCKSTFGYSAQFLCPVKFLLALARLALPFLLL